MMTLLHLLRPQEPDMREDLFDKAATLRDRTEKLQVSL